MQGRLRLAMADVPGALDAVTARVRATRGFVLEPTLQEIEGDELVVELSAADVPGPVLAEAVRATAAGADILSVWSEPVALPPVVAPAGGPPAGEDLPVVVRRALHSGIPTARWSPRSETDPAGGWHLAVPVLAAGGPPCVGLARRRGYSWRFSSLDVLALRAALVA